MRYISLFSGVEAASVAWGSLGWEPVAFSEIDKFPSAVLAERFPHVPNLGDITKVDWRNYAGSVDIVVGGSPCQSFSVAGKREGLKGASGLMFEYIRAVSEIMPRIFVWENVPGALSSEHGAAFGQLLSEMDGLGYGLAWRILDAQFFGVAQRRRRVFLVGCLGDQERVVAIRGDRQASGVAGVLGRMGGFGMRRNTAIAIWVTFAVFWIGMIFVQWLEGEGTDHDTLMGMLCLVMAQLESLKEES